jgi:hypothetical protein
MGILGQHEEDQQFPITKVDLDRTRRIVASISHDSSIKFYDVVEFMGKSRESFNPTDEYLDNQKKNVKMDSEDYDSDDDDDDDDDEEEINQQK